MKNAFIHSSEKYVNQIEHIFQLMDEAYQKAADVYKFVCNGCKDNCCETRFFHHTHIECIYLIEGFKQLSEQQKTSIIENATNVVERTKILLESEEPVRLLCPLNENGRCLIYHYRPMICRLHGIAHELQIPGQQLQYTPGCEAFIAHCNAMKIENYYSLDRTPHYIRMAQLEQAYKKEYNINQRFKATIPEMLMMYGQSLAK